MNSLLLIDSHALLRSSLRVVLKSGWPDLQVLQASTIEDAVQGSNAAPTVVLLAMAAHEEQAVYQSLPLLRERWPEVALVLLFSSETAASLGPSSCYGATAVIARTDTVDELLGVVSKALGVGTGHGEEASGWLWSAPHLPTASLSTRHLA